VCVYVLYVCICVCVCVLVALKVTAAVNMYNVYWKQQLCYLYAENSSCVFCMLKTAAVLSVY